MALISGFGVWYSNSLHPALSCTLFYLQLVGGPFQLPGIIKDQEKSNTDWRKKLEFAVLPQQIVADVPGPPTLNQDAALKSIKAQDFN